MWLVSASYPILSPGLIMQQSDLVCSALIRVRALAGHYRALCPAPLRFIRVAVKSWIGLTTRPRVRHSFKQPEGVLI